MGILVEKTWLDEHMESLPLWQQKVYRSFSSMLADTNTYPCVPARQGFLSNQLRFTFVSDPRKEGAAKQLATALREYGNGSRETGKYTSLVVFFETPAVIKANYTISDYRELFWSVLNHVTAYDEQEWPADIPTDPMHHTWEFCFHGEPYFAFCATPEHCLRKSRQFPAFFIAFQPRWVFEDLNDHTRFGRKMKKVIRQRLANYDEIAAHPDLKWYGKADNHEWKQYFLSDDTSSPSSCPFMRMKSKLTSFLK
ncbi:YqcI/YcgG family protein [Virgibacillus salexigens]|uniref:YqcI/YcgG family protein n=1 Tax=Virgibacillus salexigens TaxID=61016 RepID=UPI00190E3AC3|nr:YqcI/YcgG family protein [Virgibacillus salexigens]